ncbi:DUF2290 domain-containing protein [Streptomyces sp. NBC_00258]|uniref:DUF2290 domain-containing protein n=1 Tax=Streptomyces sp. NBC_00258 TaxID=2903642 RepID=UPI003FA79C7F
MRALPHGPDLVRLEPLLDVVDLYAADTPTNMVLHSAIRFDYDPASASPGHPAAHLTINSAHCRIACAAPMHVGRFADFFPALPCRSAGSPPQLLHRRSHAPHRRTHPHRRRPHKSPSDVALGFFVPPHPGSDQILRPTIRHVPTSSVPFTAARISGSPLLPDRSLPCCAEHGPRRIEALSVSPGWVLAHAGKRHPPVRHGRRSSRCPDL